MREKYFFMETFTFFKIIFLAYVSQLGVKNQAFLILHHGPTCRCLLLQDYVSLEEVRQGVGDSAEEQEEAAAHRDGWE